MHIEQRLGYGQHLTGLAWRRKLNRRIQGGWLTCGSCFAQSVQPLQRRCKKCQSTWLGKTLEEAMFIPGALCSGSEDLPCVKEGQDRKSIPQVREKVGIKMVVGGHY